MSPFVQIEKTYCRFFKEPTITIGKTQIYFNKPCSIIANLEVMKAVDIFWDEENRVLKLKVSHQAGENSFTLTHNLPSGTLFFSCSKFLSQIRPKGVKGSLHLPANWNEKEKAFIGTVPRGK